MDWGHKTMNSRRTIMRSKKGVRKRLQGIIDGLCSSERTIEFLVIDQMILNFNGKKDDTQGCDLRSNLCVKWNQRERLFEKNKLDRVDFFVCKERWAPHLRWEWSGGSGGYWLSIWSGSEGVGEGQARGRPQGYSFLKFSLLRSTFTASTTSYLKMGIMSQGMTRLNSELQNLSYFHLNLCLAQNPFALNAILIGDWGRWGLSDGVTV